MQTEGARGTPSSPGTDPIPAGIYIHVPFCRAKCPYCDFYSLTDHRHIPAYLEALLKELYDRRGEIIFADTIYFGGGTPSLLTPHQIERILDGVYNAFPFAGDAEITLEVNPGTIDPASLRGYRRAGVNRLNIGLQSTDEKNLRFLGRIHTAAQARDTFHWARAAGFGNIGLDLIYGLPGQTPDAWRAELNAVIGMQAEHLSCYTLTLEAHTPLAERVSQGRIAAPDEAAVGDLFALTVEWLGAHGYRQYEISNFARCIAGEGGDWRSRHNRKYWNLVPYLGFGPAAHSFLGQRRWWNHRDLSAYLADLTAGRLPVAETETLTREQQIIEAIYLGLRQTDGIGLADFRRRFDVDFWDGYHLPLKGLLEEGLLVRSHGRVRLTVAGMRLLESVVDLLIGYEKR